MRLSKGRENYGYFFPNVNFFKEMVRLITSSRSYDTTELWSTRATG